MRYNPYPFITWWFKICIYKLSYICQLIMMNTEVVRLLIICKCTFSQFYKWPSSGQQSMFNLMSFNALQICSTTVLNCNGISLNENHFSNIRRILQSVNVWIKKNYILSSKCYLFKLNNYHNLVAFLFTIIRILFCNMLYTIFT